MEIITGAVIVLNWSNLKLLLSQNLFIFITLGHHNIILFGYGWFSLPYPEKGRKKRCLTYTMCVYTMTSQLEWTDFDANFNIFIYWVFHKLHNIISSFGWTYLFTYNVRGYFGGFGHFVNENVSKIIHRKDIFF